MPRNLIDITDLSVEEINQLIATAEDIIANPVKYQDACAHKQLATLFFEPSTRTRLSFESAMLALGGKGVISVLSHVAPRDTHDMVIKMLEGDTDGARRLQLKYIPLIHALFCEVNPIPVKAAMNMLGYQAGPLRMPLTEMEEEHQETLREAMRKAGLDVK